MLFIYIYEIKLFTKLYKEEKMDYQKFNLIQMNLDKIKLYSCYVDSISRIINDYTINGNYNLKPYDIPNLTELLTKFSYHLKLKVMRLSEVWELDN